MQTITLAAYYYLPAEVVYKKSEIKCSYFEYLLGRQHSGFSIHVVTAVYVDGFAVDVPGLIGG
jgi:hypothetical protein